MKKIIIAITVISSLTISAHEKNKNILNSKNIQEIEHFLKISHPDDPRRSVMRSKLISLKNSIAIKSNSSKSVNLKPSYIEVTKAFMKQKNNDEVEEFKKLISENSTSHKEKTVKLLNQLFENDVTNKEAILLMQNNSDCNMIVRIQGKQFYNLAVPAHGENTVVVKKGDYQLKSNICDAQYISNKSIVKNMLVTLNSVSTSQYKALASNNGGSFK